MNRELKIEWPSDLLCFGGEDWWYHNRGHCDMQLMRRFARHGRVLYVNSVVMRRPNLGEGRLFFRRLARKARSMARGLVKVPEGFWVYSPITAPVHHLAWGRPLNAWFLRVQLSWVMRRIGMTRPLVWVNCPGAAETALRLSRRALVYQRTDRYEEYPGVDREQIRRYDRSLKQHAELTFFSNRKLHREEAEQCRHGAYVDHGVDYELFAGAEQDPRVPAELAGLPRPIAGFYGGVDAHTFDMALMSQVVEQLPDWTFVFVGKATIDCAPLTRRPNVVRIERQAYEQVPHFGKCFDVCLMPWNQNAWIDACNPIKLKEYLALGKPVVSTPFAQLADYGDLVYGAATAEAFAAAMRRAAAEDSLFLKEKRRAFVRPFSWDAQARRLLTLLTDACQESCDSAALSGVFPTH